MRPIIAEKGKFIYSSPLKAKINVLKFQFFWNSFCANQFIKPETTLHESPARTEAVRMYRKVRFTPFLRFSFLRIKSQVTRIIVNAESVYKKTKSVFPSRILSFTQVKEMNRRYSIREATGPNRNRAAIIKIVSKKNGDFKKS